MSRAPGMYDWMFRGYIASDGTVSRNPDRCDHGAVYWDGHWWKAETMTSGSVYAESRKALVAAVLEAYESPSTRFGRFGR